MESDVAKVGEILKRAKRVLFITGAGVSAESGIPTFRGAAAAFADGKTEEGIPFEEVLSIRTFVRKPELSWKYFFLLEKSMRGKLPNAAHVGMSDLETTGRRVWIATQNIDGLHQSAGSKNVLELHGNLRRIVCTQCDHSEYLETFEKLKPLPLCPACNAVLRPDIVLYEEQLPLEVLGEFEIEQATGFDVVFSVGTTSLFHYVTQPVMEAVQRRVPVVEINPERTPVSYLAKYRFTEAAGQVINRLVSVANSSSAE